ncbi:hypothetical protein B0T18DRAFT_431489 [Schizothecium vesticola]|uniref:Uncharacterized protein n=1 Tax=Schizothecium vesticola TaxID=314040 RepID=A0AA40BTJ7_9PEZI|nr:hypothetical protein B0T18DRAFT_431489 [Schizothecium vesticola]
MGTELGDKADLADDPAHITKIDRVVLQEDIAYCLLSMFDVSMPLLYGEGSRAFLRL